MTLSTKGPTDKKKQRLNDIRLFHKKTLEDLGVSNPYIIGKMAYKPYGKKETHVSFFPSEVNKGTDVYVEFTDRDYNFEDPKRTLYRWRFNPHYMEEYDTTESTSTGVIRYLIPVSELLVIKTYEDDEEEVEDFESIPDPDTDLPIDQMTIRDFVAIIKGKPVSRKKWLNDIIKS